MLSYLQSELPLGIDFAEIGLHILNFAILLIALYLLLYKPVKKFIKKRQDVYRQQEEDNTRSAEESLKMKEEYTGLMERAREDAVKITEEAHVNAKLAEEQVLQDAKDSAAKLILDAKEDAKSIKRQAKDDVATSVASLAASLASEILEREVAPLDNDRSIEAIIAGWKGDGENNA